MRFSSSKYFFTTRLISLFLFYIRAKCLIFVGVKTAFGVTKIAARPLQRGGKEGFVGCERLFRRTVQVRPNAFPVRHSSPSRLNRSAAQSEQGEEPGSTWNRPQASPPVPGLFPAGSSPVPSLASWPGRFTHPACESGEDLLMTVLEVRRSLMVWPSHTDCVRASRPRKSRSSPPPFSHRNLAPTNQSFLPRFLLSFASFHNDSIASSFTH